MAACHLLRQACLMRVQATPTWHHASANLTGGLPGHAMQVCCRNFALLLGDQVNQMSEAVLAAGTVGTFTVPASTTSMSSSHNCSRQSMANYHRSRFQAVNGSINAACQVSKHLPASVTAAQLYSFSNSISNSAEASPSKLLQKSQASLKRLQDRSKTWVLSLICGEA